MKSNCVKLEEGDLVRFTKDTLEHSEGDLGMVVGTWFWGYNPIDGEYGSLTKQKGESGESCPFPVILHQKTLEEVMLINIKFIEVVKS